jgi:hypothetical protein
MLTSGIARGSRRSATDVGALHRQGTRDRYPATLLGRADEVIE